MNAERLEAASQWRLRQSQGLTEAEVSELDDWLADGDNAAAYALADRAWSAFDSGQSLDVARLRRETRARLRRRRVVGGIGTVAAAVVVAVGMGGLYLSRQGQVYDNPGQGLRDVTLNDGSELTLDAETTIKVVYSAKQRRFDLQRGQASFHVARDPTRPFTVKVGDASVTALGTTFNINRWGAGATVTLAEGGIRVEPGASATGVVLTPGQQVTVQAGRLSAVSVIPQPSVSAWRNGLLVFNDDSLDEALASVNRHADREVRLADPSLGALRISGIFRAGDANAFARGVMELHDLRADVSSEAVTLQRSP